MIYLVILLAVAGVGIGSLWVQQRRQRAHLDTVEGFRASLEKIAPYAAPGPFRRAAQEGRRPMSKRAPGRAVPLDPARREAARRRVEARRRAALQRMNQQPQRRGA
ncbi:MAG: hypothetical protein ACRDKT_17900 [Actinomycetota bacterium]